MFYEMMRATQLTIYESSFIVMFKKQEEECFLMTKYFLGESKTVTINDCTVLLSPEKTQTRKSKFLVTPLQLKNRKTTKYTEIKIEFSINVQYSIFYWLAH